MESSHLVKFSTCGKFITKFNVLRCISLSETLFWTGARGRIPIASNIMTDKTETTVVLFHLDLSADLTFLSVAFKVIRFDPLAPVQTLAQGVLCKWKCSFLSVTSWIWTAAAKRLFSHLLKYDMIYFVLTKSPWFYCYQHMCYFDGRCQISKSNRWTCIFLLRVAINKALPVSTQSFASFVYKIKHIQAEIHALLLKNRSGFGAKI